MQSGYVKLWRRSLDGKWLRNHKLWAFWCWCLMKATHKEYDQVVGCQQIHLLPGEFIFGRRSAGLELGMSEREIRTAVDSLKTSQNIAVKTTNKYSIISIINWGTYQQTEILNGQQNDQQLTNKRPTTDHKQEYKNININNNIKRTFQKPSLEEIKSYCSERKNNITPQHFLDFYQANGWKVGKNPMKDWKAAIRTWEQRYKENNYGNKQRTGIIRGNPRELSPEAADAADRINAELREAKRLAAIGKTKPDAG